MQSNDKIVSISTGLVYHFTDDRNQMIEMLRQFKPSGIELNFYHPQVLLDFEPSDANIKYLTCLDYVSIHAPWVDIRYGDNQVCQKTMEKIERLYQQVQAKNVVFHPLEVDDWSVFKLCRFNCSIENEDCRKPAFKYPSEMREIFQNNPNLRFTFDFAHALTVGEDSVASFLSLGELAEIHFSYHHKKRAGHRFLHQHINTKILKLLQLLPEVVPLVIEGVMERPDQHESVRSEIALAANNHYLGGDGNDKINNRI